MEKTTLTAAKRTLIGKKVKKLRQEGLLPANLFGKNVKSEALQVPIKEFLTTFKKVGETGLVELKADKEIFHTLISKVQFNPLTREPIHAEFHAVSLTEKIKARVAIELLGESPVVKDGSGLLLQTLNEVEVEALPTDLPEKIEINVENLAAVDQQVTVGEITKLKGVEILTPAEEIIVKVVAAVSEEAKKEAEAEAAAKVAAEATTEGEAPAAQTPEAETTQAPTEEAK